MTDTPSLYFRTRPNGATVFRVSEDPEKRRLSFMQIAVANVRTGGIRTNDTGAPNPAELEEIGEWMASKKEEMSADRRQDVLALCDSLGMAAHWIQTDASDSDIDNIEARLLLAMHDVRRTLARRKSKAET